MAGSVEKTYGDALFELILEEKPASLSETKEELNAWADMYNKIASLNVIDYNSIDDVNTIRGNVGLDPLDEDQIGELHAQGEAYAE